MAQIRTPSAPARRRRKSLQSESDIFVDISAHFRERLEQEFDAASFEVIWGIRTVGQLITDRVNQWLAPFGLTAMQYSYLVRLYVEPGQRLSLDEIRRYANTTTASATSMTNVLEKSGLVRRVPNAKDGRSILAELTPRGKRLIASAAPVHIANVNLAFQSIPVREREKLSQLLRTVAAQFESQFGLVPSEPSTAPRKNKAKPVRP